MTNRAAIILAAGKGSRMRSCLPKGLHRLGGRTLLDWSLALAADVSCDPVFLVSAPDVPGLSGAVGARARICEQKNAQGTANAVRAAEDALQDFEGHVMVLYVDTPLVTPHTCEQAFAALEAGSALAVLGFEPDDPGSYGRLVTDEADRLLRIVEVRDASPEEQQIRLCNSGVMAGRWPLMREWLAQIGCDNAKGEYYLTDLVSIARDAGQPAMYVRADATEVPGVNTHIELASAESAFQRRARRHAMSGGVHLMAPETVYFSWDTELAPEVVIEPYVVFGPGVKIGPGSLVHSFSHLEGVRMGADCRIGPFARLRAGTQLEPGVGIGNFVEVKKSRIGEGSKAGHLAYIGDGDIGAGANIGAGTVFCNYDGSNKQQTLVGDGAFIGSNSSLVAPLSIGEGAYIGSGSVITDNVPAEALALGRARQSAKAGWVSPSRKKRSTGS